MSVTNTVEVEIGRGRAKGIYQIIDIRNKPPVAGLEKLFFAAVGRLSPKLDWHPGWRTASQTTRTVGSTTFGTDAALDGWMADAEAAGIGFVLMTGRKQTIDNHLGDFTSDELAELIGRYPGKVAGLAPVDLDQDIDFSIGELERGFAMGLSGATIEPGFRGRGGPTTANDPSLFPLYDYISSQGKPLHIQSGPFSAPLMKDNGVDKFDEVLTKFPDLKVIVGHGGYPYITEFLGCAYKHRNMYISLDVYAFCPGSELYIQNMHKLPEQMLFGTGYPIGSMKEMVDATLDLDLDKAVMANYLKENALRLFDISP